MKILSLVIVLVFLFTGCATKNEGADYMQISMREAKENLEKSEDIFLLDVRTESEHNERRIPGSILIPDYEIENLAPSVLPDKSSVIYLYCRTGRRSKEAALKLIALGYENVYDMGGINNWPYETESGK